MSSLPMLTSPRDFITSIMVFVMAVITAIFFFFVDWLIRTGLQALLGAF